MVMLTELLRFGVRDQKGSRAQVLDLAVALLSDDYPPVTGIILGQSDPSKKINWSDVVRIDWSSKNILIDDLAAAERRDDDAREVLLQRDILDALILDLLGRRTTRVCNLLLEEEDGVLRLKAADAGMSAMLRRVFRGHWTRARQENMFDWKYVEFLRGDPNAVANGAGYRLRINRLPAGEIARLTDYIPYLHAAELLKLLPDEKAAGVLEATSIDRQLQIIEELDEKEAVELLSLMSPDLATDLIGRLGVGKMQRFLDLMSEKCRSQIVELLRYPEDSVGGSMINDIISLPAETTCKKAKEMVQQKIEDVRFTSVVFIVDGGETKKLRGSINLRDLLASDNVQTLEEIMDPYLQPLGPFDNAHDAAYRIVSSQLSAMPVINKNGRLIGAMTVEAAIARLVPTTSSLRQLRVFS
jgi:CBS domain-containing protein